MRLHTRPSPFLRATLKRWEWPGDEATLPHAHAQRGKVNKFCCHCCRCQHGVCTLQSSLLQCLLNLHLYRASGNSTADIIRPCFFQFQLSKYSKTDSTVLGLPLPAGTRALSVKCPAEQCATKKNRTHTPCAEALSFLLAECMPIIGHVLALY